MATREDYLTVLEFGKLKEVAKDTLKIKVGDAVKMLVVDNEGARIIEGAVYGTSYTTNGTRFDVITKEGARWTNVAPPILVKA